MTKWMDLQKIVYGNDEVEKAETLMHIHVLHIFTPLYYCRMSYKAYIFIVTSFNPNYAKILPTGTITQLL